MSAGNGHQAGPPDRAGLRLGWAERAVAPKKPSSSEAVDAVFRQLVQSLLARALPPKPKPKVRRRAVAIEGRLPRRFRARPQEKTVMTASGDVIANGWNVYQQWVEPQIRRDRRRSAALLAFAWAEVGRRPTTPPRRQRITASGQVSEPTLAGIYQAVGRRGYADVKMLPNGEWVLDGGT